MSNIIFQIKYKIDAEKREEYLKVVGELKSQIKAEGLLSYDIYELKKGNEFCELFVFENEEAYENYDDSDEMISLLMDKLSSMIVEGTMEYLTYTKITE
jgi:quinol monooxygenase YgiN